MYNPIECSTFLIAKAMWKHVYIVMFPHFEDKLLINLGQNVETWPYSDVYTFLNNATVLQISSIDGRSIHGMSIILLNKVGPSCPG